MEFAQHTGGRVCVKYTAALPSSACVARPVRPDGRAGGVADAGGGGRRGWSAVDLRVAIPLHIWRACSSLRLALAAVAEGRYIPCALVPADGKVEERWRQGVYSRGTRTMVEFGVYGDRRFCLERWGLDRLRWPCTLSNARHL